jgi:hypothetical protein
VLVDPLAIRLRQLTVDVWSDEGSDGLAVRHFLRQYYRSATLSLSISNTISQQH